MSNEKKLKAVASADVERVEVRESDLTWADLEDFEDAVGMTLAAVFALPAQQRPAKAARALAWLTLRRADPSVTFESLRNRPVLAPEVVPVDPPAGLTPGNGRSSASTSA